MNKLDVENMAIFARHLKALIDKIKIAKIIYESREQRMMNHKLSYPNMDEERRADKDVEHEYDETLSAGCELGWCLPFSRTEIKDYIKCDGDYRRIKNYDKKV